MSVTSAINLGAMRTTTESSDEFAFGANMRRHFQLAPDVVYLNHGSFGATPRSVRAAQDAWRDRLERQPVHFLTREAEPELRAVALELGEFLGANGEDLVFADNATSGVNAVLRSFPLETGDEVIYTSHCYGSVKKAIRFVCNRVGAIPVEVHLEAPISGNQQVIDAVAAKLSGKTKLAVFDHIASSSAVVMPIAELIALCHERGSAVVVDGAHAPGLIPLDIPALGADYYAGNCHKWLCAPKGASFLWVARDKQATLDPLVISWGWEESFTKAFDWPGTRDFSNWLAISAALAFRKRIGDAKIRDYCNDLAASSAYMLAEAWDTTISAPRNMRAAMASIQLPTSLEATKENGQRIHDKLIDEHNIEIPVMEFGDKLWTRISAQIYNEPADYQRLATAIPQVLATIED